MQLLAPLALALAPVALTQTPVAVDHAALHPADAQLFVEVPDVAALWAAYPRAPMLRVALDPSVRAAIVHFAGQEPFDEFMESEEVRALLSATDTFHRTCRSLSFSLHGYGPASAPPSQELNGADYLFEYGTLVLALELRTVEDAASLLSGLRALSPGADAADELLRLPYFDPPVHAELRGKLLILSAGLDAGADLPASARALSASTEHRAALAGLPAAQSTPVLRGSHALGWRMLADFGRTAGRSGAEPLAVLERLAAYLDPASRGGFQMHLGGRGFVWDSFQPGRSEPAPTPDRAMLKRVPADAAAVWLGTVQGTGWLDLVRALIPEEQAEAEDGIAESRVARVGRLLDALAVGPTFVAHFPEPTGLAPPQIQVWFELADPEAFARDWADLLLQVEPLLGEVALERKTYKGHELTTFADLGSADPTFVVVDGDLLVTVQSLVAKRHIRALDRGELGTETFAGNPAYLARAKELESAQSFLHFDWPRILPRWYKSALALASLAGMGGGPEIDPTVFPTPELLAGALLPTWDVSRRTADGLHVRRETPYGPETWLGMAAPVFVVPIVMGKLAAREVAPAGR